eukprot:Hpha_TRINITY_DN15131_c3_g4::TRINITY_DN15131_c3_g4_i1::g.128171::m.128171
MQAMPVANWSQQQRVPPQQQGQQPVARAVPMPAAAGIGQQSMQVAQAYQGHPGQAQAQHWQAQQQYQPQAMGLQQQQMQYAWAGGGPAAQAQVAQPVEQKQQPPTACAAKPRLNPEARPYVFTPGQQVGQQQVYAPAVVDAQQQLFQQQYLQQQQQLQQLQQQQQQQQQQQAPARVGSGDGPRKVSSYIPSSVTKQRSAPDQPPQAVPVAAPAPFPTASAVPAQPARAHTAKPATSPLQGHAATSPLQGHPVVRDTSPRSPPGPPESILRAAKPEAVAPVPEPVPAPAPAPAAPPSPRAADPGCAVGPGIELIHLWREFTDQPLGAVWAGPEKGKGRVTLARVQVDTAAEHGRLEEFIGRQLIAIATSRGTVHVHCRDDVTAAIGGRRGVVFQFRTLSGSAPEIPVGTPIVKLDLALTPSDLRRRLASKISSELGDGVISDICYLALNGSPRRWSEECIKLLHRARDEQKVTDRELYKGLFKAIGWEEAPMLLLRKEEDLACIVAATIFAQRRRLDGQDAEVFKLLRAGLNITSSDAEYEARLKEKQLKEKQREQERERKREEDKIRQQEQRKRMEERVKQLDPVRPTATLAASSQAIQGLLRGPSVQPYPLTSKWVLWRLGGPKGNEALSAPLGSLEELWQVLNAVTSGLGSIPAGEGLAVLREDIDPDADDSEGGVWRGGLMGEEQRRITDVFHRSCAALVGGTLSGTGIGIERKKVGGPGDRVLLSWAKSDEEGEVRKIGEELRSVVLQRKAAVTDEDEFTFTPNSPEGSPITLSKK